VEQTVERFRDTSDQLTQNVTEQIKKDASQKFPEELDQANDTPRYEPQDSKE